MPVAVPTNDFPAILEAATMSVARIPGWRSQNTRYGNRFTDCNNGHRHRSKHEATRCDELHLLQKGGEISKLEQQPRFKMVVNDLLICTYVADFRYLYKGAVVVEDAKGFPNDVYPLKKKLLKALWNIEVQET